jgi:hypothetical protein
MVTFVTNYLKISIFFGEKKFLETRRNILCHSFEPPHILVGKEGMQKCSVTVVDNKRIRFWIRERIREREKEEAETE